MSLLDIFRRKPQRESDADIAFEKAVEEAGGWIDEYGDAYLPYTIAEDTNTPYRAWSK